MGTRVLIIEDEISLRNSLKKLLELKHFNVFEAGDFKTAEKKIISDKYEIFILDLRLPDKNGIELLIKYPEKMEGKTIIITAHATIQSAVDAIKNGAFSYLEKPLDEDLLFVQMKKIIEIIRLKEKNISLKKELFLNQSSKSIIYKSNKMASVMNQAKKLSKTNDIIIIQGETGVGKEIIANYIHWNSVRKDKVFLPINCSSIPEHLFESELFGFKKGAFSGATKDYDGRFIQASEGTLFLDEISDMPLNMQSKLLRILDDGMIYQLGNKHPQRIDLRLITASNRDLWEEVRASRFRKDLYFRLRETMITIPPLRERKEDIFPLARHFITLFNNLYDKNIKDISKTAREFLLEYSWEGNVRELKNAIRSIFAITETNQIDINDLILSLKPNEKTTIDRFLPLSEYENNYIKKALIFNNFNIKKTSEILGISRTRLYRKIENMNLEKKSDN